MPRLDGFDGAHFQFDTAEPDLPATLLAGLFWIAWKVSQSIAYIDPTFATIRSRWTGFRMRGMYHWLSSTTDVDAQAAHYLKTVGVFGVGDFAMLDAEEKGITVNMCLRWCELVEAITHRPAVIYTGLYVAGGTIWKSSELRMSKYGPRPFIVAAYVTAEQLAVRMVQTGSQNFLHDGWQFSSNGPVPGIAGRCDMDQIDNVAAFELACEISHIAPPQPSGDDDMQIRLLIIDGYAARLLAECPDAGDPLRACWSGPADESGTTNARIEWFRQAFKPTASATTFEMGPFTADLLKNISLDDELPAGMSADLFANTATIEARMSQGVKDDVARKGVQDLNTAVGAMRQREADAGAALEKASVALLG